MPKFAHDITALPRTEDIRCDEDVGFDVFQLSNDVLRGLEAIGFQTPSPVQLRAIPYGRCGFDMVVQSKSGTGKTCVFSVIALDSLEISLGTQVIILAPTHEIAKQDSEVFQAIGRKIQKMVVATCIGGQLDDKKKLKTCHVIIGSPGKIRHLIEKSKISVQSARLLILDEADFMVSQEKMRADVNWICSSLPDNRQTIAASATFSTHLSEYVTMYMNSPIHVKMCSKNAVLLGVQQMYHYVNSVKFDGSYSKAKCSAVYEILNSVDFKQCIVFYNNHEKAELLRQEIEKLHPTWEIGFISSQIDTVKRSVAFSSFRQGRCRVLISSDLISRGADVKDVDLIIHLDFPRSVDTYLHRVGRAGRFGSSGISIGIIALSPEFDLLKKYQEKLGITIPEMTYPPSKNLIQSCKIETPSCCIGDLVTADQITSETEMTNLCDDNTMSRSSSLVKEFVKKIEDDPPSDNVYSDMLASFDEVGKFLNLGGNFESTSTPSSDSSLPTVTTNLSLSKNFGNTSLSSIGNYSIAHSDSSELARCYGSAKSGLTFDNLVKTYVDEREEVVLLDDTASRCTSSATVTAVKDTGVRYTPSPTPRTEEQSEKKVEKMKTKNFGVQTENISESSGQVSGQLPDLQYIPMPPLMPLGGYSQFAEWLQNHGSLIFSPVERRSCNCQCHKG